MVERNTYSPYGFNLDTLEPLNHMPPVRDGGVVTVSGYLEAEHFPVAPQTRVIFLDRDGKSIYVKTFTGIDGPEIDIYRKEETGNVSGPPTQEQTEYATKKDLEALRDELTALINPTAKEPIE
jgi:hypothetical protein